MRTSVHGLRTALPGEKRRLSRQMTAAAGLACIAKQVSKQAIRPRRPQQIMSSLILMDTKTVTDGDDRQASRQAARSQ